MRKVVLLLALLGLPGWAQSYAQIPLPAAPTKFVTDAAGVIPDVQEYVLNERLAEFERITTHQVIVYVDRNIPLGTTLEEMGAEAIRTWGVGQVKRDNGAILFLFIDSRDSRIEVGYGLEGTLTDAVSKRILVDMRPLLRNRDYAGAVTRGADAIVAAITTEPPAAEAAPQPMAAQAYQPEPYRDSSSGAAACMGPFFVILLGFFIIMVIRSGGVQRPTIGGRPRDDSDDDSSSSSWTSSSSSSSWGGSSSSGSSSSSSGSSSGFSGGGGSGGGGGASDKW
jgi:uncharacterized protein